MFYSIRHLTKFLYKSPVSESIMETRMHPRSDANQRCLTFSAIATTWPTTSTTSISPVSMGSW